MLPHTLRCCKMPMPCYLLACCARWVAAYGGYFCCTMLLDADIYAAAAKEAAFSMMMKKASVEVPWHEHYACPMLFSFDLRSVDLLFPPPMLSPLLLPAVFHQLGATPATPSHFYGPYYMLINRFAMPPPHYFRHHFGRRHTTAIPWPSLLRHYFATLSPPSSISSSSPWHIDRNITPHVEWPQQTPSPAAAMFSFVIRFSFQKVYATPLPPWCHTVNIICI